MRARLALVTVGLGALIAAMSCRGATKITLDLRTDPDCAIKGTIIAAGASPTETETSAPAASTRACGGGAIGTLVVVPRSNDDADVSIKVVVGVARDVEQCAPPLYEGCIVQRRHLAYIPHEDLVLPIELLHNCVDVPCDAVTTCDREGRCVSAALPGCTAGTSCDLEPTTPGIDGAPPPPSSDAGVDATTDAPSEAAPLFDAGDGTYCSGVVCAAPTICCYERVPDHGDCSTTSLCQPGGTQALLHCTPETNCGPGKACCVDPGHQSQCRLPKDCIESPAPFRYLCHDFADCPAGHTRCDKTMDYISPAGGYFGQCL